MFTFFIPIFSNKLLLHFFTKFSVFITLDFFTLQFFYTRNFAILTPNVFTPYFDFLHHILKIPYFSAYTEEQISEDDYEDYVEADKAEEGQLMTGIVTDLFTDLCSLKIVTGRV